MTPLDKDVALVTRRMIVRYAGAVQDFNPMHYDDEFARKSGLPGIIAHGPLTFALVLDALVAVHGAEKIAGLRTRLKAPVFPGDRIHLKCDAEGNLSATVGEKEVLSGSLLPKS